MGLFPQSFIDDLKLHADIVQVIQDVVPLKRAGSTYKGLCPFHAEKTPSFHVNRERGFFHCFGCGVGGDVVKFVELQDKLTFPEAVRQLARRFGLNVPETEDAKREAADEALREALLKVHERAAAYFREQLAGPAGATARRQLQTRGLAPETIDALAIGYAPPSRVGLKGRLTSEGFPMPLLLQSGLIVERDEGPVDRFRHRLMIPICRESGSVIAFGGRAMDAEQQPKYLNSPETPIYSKGRTLYGLHLTKSALRRLGYAVLVEGYFDFAQALQAGVTPLVASCGTALTNAQARVLKRYVSKVILSFDPDAAGQGAALRSCELLVTEGFHVNVAMLPVGEDPDTFVRRHGGAAYTERLKTSRPYLEYVLDRGAEGHDFRNPESRLAFLNRMLPVAAQIPEATARDQFADRLAHTARITEEVVRAEIRRAAVARQTTVSARQLPTLGMLKPAERGLIWAVFHDPSAASAALATLEDDDMEGLVSRAILLQAMRMTDWPPETLPNALGERLNEGEAALVAGVTAELAAPAPAEACARALKRLRFERDREALQREIDRLQETGSEEGAAGIEVLWARKKDLLQRIEELGA